MAGEDVRRNLNDFNVSKDVGTILRQHGTYMEIMFVSVSGRMMHAPSPWLTDTSKLLSD